MSSWVNGWPCPLHRWLPSPSSYHGIVGTIRPGPVRRSREHLPPNPSHPGARTTCAHRYVCGKEIVHGISGEMVSLDRSRVWRLSDLFRPGANGMVRAAGHTALLDAQPASARIACACITCGSRGEDSNRLSEPDGFIFARGR